MRTLSAVWQLPIVVLMTCFVVGASAKNLPPMVSLLTPTNGQTFQSVGDIPIAAQADDTDGFVHTVEFFVNGSSVGITTNNPSSASPINPFQFTLRRVASGEYRLSAKATDDLGAVSLSKNIVIKVLPEPLPTVVTVVATDPLAAEPSPKDTGLFTITRTGNLKTRLNVRYSVSGTAINGVDYVKLPGLVTIPEGKTAATITVTPLPDKAIEGNETIVIVLQQLVFVAAPRAEDDYLVGSPDSATVTIIENATTNFPPKVDIVSPKNEAVFETPAKIEINADAADADGTVKEVAFYAGDKLLGRDAQAPFHLTWTNVAEGRYILTAVATDDKAAKTTSIPITIIVKTRTEQPGTLIAAGSVWKYLDDGADQGTAWRKPTYDDSQWAAGPAQLGYGDGDEATVVRFGPDPQHKQITTYFRQSFKVANSSSYSNLVVRLLRDDGAVVYMNGTEVFRSNLPVGPILFSTLATSTVGGADESTHFYSAAVDPHLLTNGVNVLAVEVHQAAVTSSDLSFDLELIANTQPPVDNAKATLTLNAPKDAESFPAPANITISATAIDPKGYISHVEFFEGERRIGFSQIDFFRAPDPGTPIEHMFVWTNVPPGSYKLTARAIDTDGESITSKPVQVVVRSPEEVTFVNRDLPEIYLPGQKLKVQLNAKPRSTTQIYAVEDTAPNGWTVGAISDDGVFDPAKHKIKFGPFLDNKARSLTYEITPPENASGPKEFSGTGSADGVNSAISGDKTIPSALRHPADNKAANNAITILELTAYASAWRTGTAWPIPPNPIPISYVTRAGALWKGGEQYVFDPSAGPAPAWWVNKPQSLIRPAITELSLPFSPDSRTGTATRTLASALGPDASFIVTLALVPAAGVNSFAVEDQPPFGWGVSDISDGGAFDPMTRKVKWGLFLDDRRRTLMYHVAPSTKVSGQTTFVGMASLDGLDLPIGGDQQPIVPSANPAAVLISIARSPMSTRLEFRGEPGRQYQVQASDDLERWVELDWVDGVGGGFQFIDPGATASAHRFYRAVLEP